MEQSTSQDCYFELRAGTNDWFSLRRWHWVCFLTLEFRIADMIHNSTSFHPELCKSFVWLWLLCWIKTMTKQRKHFSLYVFFLDVAWSHPPSTERRKRQSPMASSLDACWSYSWNKYYLVASVLSPFSFNSLPNTSKIIKLPDSI